MCGIAALFGDVPDSIVPMTEIVRHRGPDAGNVRRFERAHLGHRRLSILDLSEHGDQPMSSPDGRFHITYNGEIYNYLELRRELENQGHRFLSETDTEVLLAAFCQWGPLFLSKLNGMFAFVVYDTVQKRFFAARDRFGIKPLYVWISPGNYVAFASEIKQFTVLPEFAAKLNHQRAYDYLQWSILNHTHETLFAGVMQIRGGEYWEGGLDERFFHPEKWYSVPSGAFQGTKEEAAAEYRELLSRSISLRLRSDVPLGSCLSGGLDSSSIVCLMRDQLKTRGLGGQQTTFSACSEVEAINEKRFIDLVVSHCRPKAWYTNPRVETLIAEIDDIVWHQDEPFATTSIFAQWEVFKLARQHHVKVMLDGQGADEQLAGYTSFYTSHLHTLYRTFRWKTLALEMLRAGPSISLGDAAARLGSRILPGRLQDPVRKLYGVPSEKCGWICLKARRRHPYTEAFNLDVPGLCRHMVLTSSLPMLLHFEDRNSMAHSIEARTPFLDFRLVEFTLGLPGDLRLSNGWTKQVLREAMKGIIPEEIRLRRDKIGFATAEWEWIKQPSFRKLLAASLEAAEGMISHEVLQEYDRMRAGKAPFSHKFWKTICFGRWVDRFSVK